MNRSYRPEIDGLRAVAVLAVMIYHGQPSWLPGGFVGVDMFFVISGYLITSILVKDYLEGRFSYASFYERRVRRLIPALLVCLSVSAFAGYVWLLPSDRRETFHSLTYVSLFLSNIFFFKHSGYFDTASELKPLLHTWSLAVEEQFYLIFPVLLVFLLPKRARWTSAAIGLLLVVSLVTSIWLNRSSPNAGFYLLPARGWELLAGSLCALLARRTTMVTPRDGVAHALATLGLVSISVSLFAIDASTASPFPVPALAVIGTCLIIISSEHATVVRALLSVRPLVGIGLISYSAYLWHQPILVFARHRQLEKLSELQVLVLLSLTLTVAWFSWKWIEQPIRRKAVVAGRGIWVLVAVSTVGLAVLGAAGRLVSLDARPPGATHLPDQYFLLSRNDVHIVGLDGRPCSGEIAEPCLSHLHPTATGRSLLVGDSHSGDFVDMYRSWLQASQRSGDQLSVSGCAFLASQTISPEGTCARAYENLLRAIQSARYNEYLIVGSFIDHTARLPNVMVERDIQVFTELIRGMTASGAQVTIFLPRPVLRYSPIKAASLGKAQVNVEQQLSDAVTSAWLQGIQNISTLPGVRLFSQSDPLRRASVGTEAFNGHDAAGKPLYRDESHLTASGAALVFASFAREDRATREED